ncbi:MAG TPA: hypothetical protein VH679_04065 [Vicinamibacterales bacterium]
MTMTVRGRRSIGALVMIAVLTPACATSINHVLADPSRYRNRDVTINGSVTESVSIADRGAYRIDDRSGQLWVVSAQGVPRKGARVSVKGTIRDVFDLGSLGGRLNLPPGLTSGLVMVESSHRAR